MISKHSSISVLVHWGSQNT